MPRHDRSYGEHHSFRPGGGKVTRRTRTPKSTYAAKQSTASPIVIGTVVPIIEMGRKGGSSATTPTKPQQPKPTKKGGPVVKRPQR